MDKMKMGIFLQTLRKEKSLTQEDEAEIFAITPQAISKWESGQSIPDVDTLEKLSRFYGVTINEILAGESNGYSQNNGTPSASKEKGSLGLTNRIAPFIASCVFMVLTLLFYFIPCFDVYNRSSYSYVTFTMYNILGSGVANPLGICVWLAFLSTLTIFGLGFGYFFDGKRVLGYRLAQEILGWSVFALYIVTAIIAWATSVGVIPGCFVIILIGLAYIILFYALPQNKKQRLKESLKQ